MERSRRRPLGWFGVLVGMAVGAAAAAMVARRWLEVVEVRGGSMAPALIPGDLLLVESRTYARRAPRPGEVVLAADPRDLARELVKRVATLQDGSVELRGDAPRESTDSRSFGAVPVAQVRWRAVLRYWPPGRIGWIPAVQAAALLELEPMRGVPACSAFGDLVTGRDAN